jgi:hypothetical protein
MAVVSYTHAVATKLQEWAAVASQIGLRAEFAAAVREMRDRLRTNPEAWGDPIKDLPGARLTVYHRYGPLVIVKYAVHFNGTPVFVTDVVLTPGTDLWYAAPPPSP